MSLAASLDEIQLKIAILESSLAAYSFSYPSSGLVERQNGNAHKTSISSICPSTPSCTSLINKVASFLEDDDEEGYRKVSHSLQHSTTESDQFFLEKTFQKELEALIFSSSDNNSKVQRELSSSTSPSSVSDSLKGCPGKEINESKKMTTSESKDYTFGTNSGEEWCAGTQRGTVEDEDIMHARGIERAASIVFKKLREKANGS